MKLFHPPSPLFSVRASVKSAGNTLLTQKTLLSSLILPNLCLKKSKNQILRPLLQRISIAHHGMMTRGASQTGGYSVAREIGWNCTMGLHGHGTRYHFFYELLQGYTGARVKIRPSKQSNCWFSVSRYRK